MRRCGEESEAGARVGRGMCAHSRRTATQLNEPLAWLTHALRAANPRRHRVHRNVCLPPSAEPRFHGVRRDAEGRLGGCEALYGSAHAPRHPAHAVGQGMSKYGHGRSHARAAIRVHLMANVSTRSPRVQAPPGSPHPKASPHAPTHGHARAMHARLPPARTNACPRALTRLSREPDVIATCSLAHSIVMRSPSGSSS